MRRIQSSAQLLERQRNPGVGYWSAAHSASPQLSNTGPSRSGRVTPIMEGGCVGVTSPGSAGGGARPSLDSVVLSGASQLNGISIGGVASPASSEAVGKNDEEEVNLEVSLHRWMPFMTRLIDCLLSYMCAVPTKRDPAVLGTQGNESKSYGLNVISLTLKRGRRLLLTLAKSCEGIIRYLTVYASRVTSLEC